MLTQSCSVAQESFKHLFTTGFDRDCTPDDVMQHMQHNKIRFKFVKKIPCKDDDYRASFKLTDDALAKYNRACICGDKLLLLI